MPAKKVVSKKAAKKTVKKPAKKAVAKKPAKAAKKPAKKVVARKPKKAESVKEVVVSPVVDPSGVVTMNPVPDDMVN